MRSILAVPFQGRPNLVWAGLITLLVVGASLGTGLTVVFGAGESMEPRFQTCDVVFIDTTRDSTHQVTLGEVIAYQSESEIIVHEVVGVTFDNDYVLATGVNSPGRERVTSDQIVGVVIGHLPGSAVCS